jgi:16S rRNA G966 N2-methylase RsmD
MMVRWLRDKKIFPDASVDLVYLDPPFNSNADYNVLFREACLRAWRVLSGGEIGGNQRNSRQLFPGKTPLF